MMYPPDVKADARRAFEVLKAGGVALLPADIGYFLATGTSQGLEKIFKGKKRGPHKRHPTIGTIELEKELHLMEPYQAEIVKTLTQDLGLPLAVVAKYDENHPVLKGLDEERLEASTSNGTIHMAINTGAFTDELMKLCYAENFLLQGSSANPTGTG
jgi:tRNA A37 threonylcarbamoyladenosine synthetase subunit TsaC/SUA5/YrdC